MQWSLYAEVIVDNKSANTDMLFSYKVPNKYLNTVKIGMRVFVPFGFGNRLLEGIIIKLKTQCEIEEEKIKYIDSIIDTAPILSESLVKLGLWMREKYLSKYIEVIQTIMPTGISKKVNRYIKLREPEDQLKLSNITSKNQKKVVKYLIENGEADVDNIKENLNMKNVNKTLKSLESKGIIEIFYNVHSSVSKKFEQVVYKNFSKEEANSILEKLNTRATKQREIIKYISGVKCAKLKDLMVNTSSTLSSVKSLENKGYIKIVKEEVKRNPITRKIKMTSKLPLTPAQKECVDTIYNHIIKGIQNKFLIHGVTGSGKTEIYLQLLEKMLQLNKQTIVLVPEISLTPQTVERFVGRFGDRVAVLHSRLSLGERYDEWRKIKNGDVQIVVGARSAIFAPFDNLGLIIIDEEHETSYKSSMNPKYNAIEVAEKRCQIEGASLILGSATPSIESYHRAQKGEIKLLTLPERVNKKPLPPIEIVDMKKELDKGNKTIFSEKLINAISENLENNKQTILFLNRRGFSTFVSCRKCGYVAKCKNCDISLTYHITDNMLKCHYCGLSQKPPLVCPECGSKYIKYFGIGTQKVEEIVKKTFPNARVARMDVDTTTRKGSHEKIFNSVKRGEIDILIGTQMISKGLDFPNVTLVGIIAADINLNIPDFKASERTFQLTTQVSGRAGRGQSEGRVIMQTYEPEHYSIQTAKKHDYISFYNKEILLRKEFLYPPFTNIISILMTSNDEKTLIKSSKQIAQNLLETIKKDNKDFKQNRLLGPNSAPIPKIKGNHRWMILIKCTDDEMKGIKGIIRNEILSETKGKLYENVKFSIDINPISII